MDREDKMEFARFMASPAGRGIRIAAGVAIVVSGLVKRGPGGAALAFAGLVPIYAGAFNRCLLAPIMGVPFSGDDV